MCSLSKTCSFLDQLSKTLEIGKETSIMRSKRQYKDNT